MPVSGPWLLIRKLPTIRSSQMNFPAINRISRSLWGGLVALAAASGVDAQIPASELVAPKIQISGDNLNFTVQPSVAGRRYQLEWSDSMGGAWVPLGPVWVGDGNNLVITTPYESTVQRRFYRLALSGGVPAGFVPVPAGSFQMGDQSSPLVGLGYELPVHTVQVSAFYLAKTEVTKAAWDEVWTWGLTNGYPDLPAGGGETAAHPVQAISWHAAVKWCNARSEKEGLTPCYTVAGATYKTGTSTPVCNWAANGYRLPTEAEWEKAARGGSVGLNFPWGNSISHNSANFNNVGVESYQTGTKGYHPTYGTGSAPFTSPVGSFAGNGFGLHDMIGNVWEWCWDWDESYSASPGTDPHGAASGFKRVYRGGAWASSATYSRCAVRLSVTPSSSGDTVGFRLARIVVP
jgi:formylglycine-generating enzyme required for sulfatase activity